MEQRLAETIRAAAAERRQLAIRGSGSKTFYTGVAQGEILDTRGLQGIVSYQPSELVLTARTGTSLVEIEAALTEQGQMLACEPPHFGDGATLGGVVACGFSGPRRPWGGAVRDFVLGVRMVNGQGEVLHFGGQVMKNVAGFDVSRLMAGSLGSLGLLLEVSLKVLPRPAYEITLRRECTQAGALAQCAAWAARPLPLSAAAWLNGALYVRLSASEAAVRAAAQATGGEAVPDGTAFWQSLREHAQPFFTLAEGETLWRLSLPPAAPVSDLAGRWCDDWGGAQRWLVTAQDAEAVRQAACGAGGHAVPFRGAQAGQLQLAPGLAALHDRLKAAFDPHGVFSPVAR